MITAQLEKTAPSALSDYRVLDLTEEKGFLCGKILADLGADVIKIEKPGGDPARLKGPYIACVPHPEKSISWISYNVNKRGMVLDLESKAGRDIFLKLVKTAHFLIESEVPGYLETLELDYRFLKKINPALVMASITPFGRTGPYSKFNGSDLVCWAMGGMAYITGDENQPPLQVSLPQAYCVAGTYAAVGALIAHYYRERTGKGQHVDISVQACIPWVAQNAPDYWPCFKGILGRSGDSFKIPSDIYPEGLSRRLLWKCKDGYICTYLIAGGPAKRMNAALNDWMRDEGIILEGLEGFSWDYFDLRRVSQEFIDRIETALATFFLKHKKNEIFEQGRKRGVMIYPVSQINELLENPHLIERNFWKKIEAPNREDYLIYPGEWAKMSLTPLRIEKPAPLIGEHNKPIMNGLNSNQISNPATDQKEQETIAQPFEGLLVIDFSWAVAAPIVTKYFAEHGATVIKIESPNPNYQDIVRISPPYVADRPDSESSGLFLRLCPNKLGTTIDLKKAGGRELIKALIKKADIVVENFRVGVLDKVGLGYEEVKKINPEIVFLSSTNLGQTGPYRSMAGFGNLLTAYAGFYDLIGWDDKQMFPLPGAYTDYVSPPFAFAALVAALSYRRKTGKGQYIDVSQMECGLQFLTPALLNYSANGIEWKRTGNRSAYACPHGIYQCNKNNTWCAISINTEQEWNNFKIAIGRPSWTEDIKYALFSNRKHNEALLDEHIEAYTLSQTDIKIFETLQKHGVRCGMVQNSKQLFEDPQLQHRKLYHELYHPLVGKHFVLTEPFILSETPSDLNRAAPCLGQDNMKVCKDILKLPTSVIDELILNNIFAETASKNKS